jgi:hypothetical protein
MRHVAALPVLLVGLGLVAAAARAQEVPAPAGPDAREEEALRRETGELLGQVVERTTRPAVEQAELELTIVREGRPFERAARVEVSLRAAGDGEDEALRLRFREPPALLDHAWLQVWRDGQATCRRWSPDRPRPERVPALPDSWRLAGSGLTLGLLRGERAAAWRWRLAGEERRDGLRLHLLEATPAAGEAGFPGAARRLLRVEVERRLPLEVEWLDAQGARLARARLGDWRALRGRLRPFALEVSEEGRLTRARATLRRGEAPAAHFDPDTFWR